MHVKYLRGLNLSALINNVILLEARIKSKGSMENLCLPSEYKIIWGIEIANKINKTNISLEKEGFFLFKYSFTIQNTWLKNKNNNIA